MQKSKKGKIKLMVLTNNNYYSKEANKAYMSVSQFKDFTKCEAMAMAKLNGEFEQSKTTALLVGSYVDSYFEGTLEEFKETNTEIFSVKIFEDENTAKLLPEEYLTKNGTIKTNKLSEAKKLFPEAFVKTLTLKSDYIQAETIIKRVEKDKLFMKYMAGKKQIIRTGELFGAKWKIKIDSLCKDKIVDLKCMRSMDRIMGMSFVEHWHYDWQMAIYREIERFSRQKKRKKNVPALETYLAVATKETPTNLEIIHIPDWHLQECLDEIEKLMPRVLEVKSGQAEPERCGVCEYCRQTKVLKEPIEFDEVGFSNKDLKAMRGEM